MRYYDFRRNWGKKCVPHLMNKEVQSILAKDFAKYCKGRQLVCKRLGLGGDGWQYDPSEPPHYYESCDWWLALQGRKPAYLQYVKHGACHWLVNFNLKLAQLAEPNYAWRIVTSDLHSCVWNGLANEAGVLFDINFYTMKVPVEETIEMTLMHDSVQILKPGKLLKTYVPESI